MYHPFKHSESMLSAHELYSDISHVFLYEQWSLPLMPITRAPRSKAWKVFAGSNTAIFCSNPTQSTDMCLC